MARKFYYTCAGMFLLALSYQLGANTATAQAGANVWSANFLQHTGASLIGRSICAVSTGSGVGAPTSTPPVPGAAAVAAFDVIDRATSGSTAGAIAVLEDGSVYEIDPAAGRPEWILTGTLCTGPVSTKSESWGQLKARYRSTPPVTPRMTVRPGADNR
jgi:hypothetical protein